MEGVGARLGRSSARYAPTTVFSGPVRRWKKKWVPLTNPNNSNSNNNQSHLLLYKWAPITPFFNGSAAATPPSSGKDAVVSAMDTPPSAAEDPVRRKFRYIPVSLLEQKMEINGKSDDDSMPDDVDTSLQPAQVNGSDRKADESDALMDEAQCSSQQGLPIKNMCNLKVGIPWMSGWLSYEDSASIEKSASSSLHIYSIILLSIWTAVVSFVW